MHECPICGQTCDCDGEDTWFSYPYNLDCTCNCEEERDADEDDLMPDDDDLEEMSQAVTRVDEQRNEVDETGQKSPSCLPTQHSWKEEYYGYKCERCQMFIPYGSEPWLPVDE